MSEECQITNNDLVLYVSVLTVLVLIFPLLDLLIIRVTWLYKDGFFLPWSKGDLITRRESYFSRTRTLSSFSSRSQHVHPMQRTAATLVLLNEESRETLESPGSQKNQEDSIIYGKSFPRDISVRGADIEDTSRFIRSADEVNLKSKFAEKRVLPKIDQRRTATKIDSLPPIETPAVRDISMKRRLEKVSVTRDTAEVMYENYITATSFTDRITVVTPVSEREDGATSQPTLTRIGFQSREFVDKLAGTSTLYQDVSATVHTNTSSKTNLIEASSHDSTPVLGERRLLNRPDNTRRKANKLGTTHSPTISPK